MARPTDKIEGEILPDAELNPLLNPLLAANMGRWAEVYFTSPPEKRGQAVSDLVRELRNQPLNESASPQPLADANPAAERIQGKKNARSEEMSTPSDAESRRTCSACSADNPASQRFCGMCGAALSGHHSDETDYHASEAAIEASAEQEQRRHGTELGSVAEYGSEEYAGESSSNYADPNYAEYDRENSAEAGWRIPEADLPHFAQEAEAVPYRFRLYVGLAVALLLGALVYMKWHGTGGFSGDSSQPAAARVIPDAPPPAPSTHEPANARTVLPTEGSTGAAAAPGAATPAPAAPATTAASAVSAPATPPPTAAERRNQLETNSRQALPVKAKLRPASPPAIPSAATSPVDNGQSGTEELATAQKYLNGNRIGAASDNREAAQWLWKAVSKGNATATLLLSDLYLRGDGVPKSCDQARLLLDVAARKGKASAGERLRHLQAFGCQ